MQRSRSYRIVQIKKKVPSIEFSSTNDKFARRLRIKYFTPCAYYTLLESNNQTNSKPF